MVENYLPIAFAVAVTFALAYPVPGRFLVNIVVAGNVHIIQVRLRVGQRRGHATPK